MQPKWVQAPHAVVTVGKEHQIPRQSEQFELGYNAVLMSRHSNALSVRSSAYCTEDTAKIGCTDCPPYYGRSMEIERWRWRLQASRRSRWIYIPLRAAVQELSLIGKPRRNQPCF